jgi:hypothetical protein
LKGSVGYSTAFVPQPAQNRAPAMSSPPQPMQNFFAAAAATGVPQPAQKRAPGGSAARHEAQAPWWATAARMSTWGA